MRPYKILVFIFSVIAALALIAAFFPADGIKVFSTTLRFPTLEQIMLKDVAQNENHAVIPIDTIEPVHYTDEFMDTVSYYKQFIEEAPCRFYLPASDIAFFDQFFEKLERAKAEQRTVRLLHYGDSQIEMDRMTSDLRSYFQELFGGGGPGLIPLVQSIATTSVSQYYSGNYSDYAIYGTSLRIKGTEYGLMGRFFRITGNGHLNINATKHSKVDQKLGQFSKVTLLFKDLQGDFSATLSDKKKKYESTQTSDTIGLFSFVWQLDTPSSKLTLSMKGNADIYGVMVDDGYGVNVDNIPIRGSSGTFFTQINSTSLKEQYAMSDVGLIILQFGGNSVPGVGPKGAEYYKVKVGEQLAYLQKHNPGIPILFIGPSDMSTREGGVLKSHSGLPYIIDALKEVTEEHGVAYWDMYEAMGGNGSMIQWVKNGYAGSDYIHFTSSGAKKMGGQLTDAFAKMYELYILRKENPDFQFVDQDTISENSENNNL